MKLKDKNDSEGSGSDDDVKKRNDDASSDDSECDDEYLDDYQGDSMMAPIDTKKQIELS